MNQLLYGREIAADINEETREALQSIAAEYGVSPKLRLLTADEGDTLKRAELLLHEEVARNLGIQVETQILGKDATDEELLDLIELANGDPGVHGILVLLPLPPHMDQDRLFQAISPAKELEGQLEGEDDIDILDFGDIDTLNSKQSTILTAVRTLLQAIEFDLPKSRNVFITESTIRDNPFVDRLVRMTERISVPVAIVTTDDPNARAVVKNADLVVVSVSSPELIDDTYLKRGAVVIDFLPVMVGEKYSEKKQRMVPILKGGVNADAALRKASFVAPALGSIGPIIVAMMMHNLMINCKNTVSMTECVTVESAAALRLPAAQAALQKPGYPGEWSI
jgi:methylenetetrahydrofolate dehydrogenase (NADP+)/methenyltetrahydrofolate cyclohydrolase